MGSRLTPLAQDWLKHKKVQISYGSMPIAAADPARAATEKSAAIATSAGASVSSTSDAVLWWCDGPCGQAKAAIAAQARETRLEALNVTPEPKNLVAAVRLIAKTVRDDQAAGGVLLVTSAASAVVYANRCRSIRAVPGTCRQSVEQGVQQVAANMLIIEHPYQTLSQVRNMLSVFIRGIAERAATDWVHQQLNELAGCE